MGAIKIFCFLSAATVLFSCGIKGPPLPPIEEETVQKQMAAEAQAISADASQPAFKEKKKK